MDGKGNQEPRKWHRYIPEQTDAVLEELAVGRSVVEVARELGMPHTTLQDYRKRKYPNSPHSNLAITPEEYRQLVPLSRTMVKLSALAIIKISC